MALLLDARADPNAANAAGSGSLLHAVCEAAAGGSGAGSGGSGGGGGGGGGGEGEGVWRAELLLRHGADASAANVRGEAPSTRLYRWRLFAALSFGSAPHTPALGGVSPLPPRYPNPPSPYPTVPEPTL